LRKLIKSISLEELEVKIKIKKWFYVINITDNKMEYIHTDHCNYNDFVIGYGHHAIIPHSWVCFQKMDVNMLMVVLVI
jgi:hypothetical protein